MSIWHGPPMVLNPPSPLALPELAHPTHCHQKSTSPIGPELALMGKTHISIYKITEINR